MCNKEISKRKHKTMIIYKAAAQKMFGERGGG